MKQGYPKYLLIKLNIISLSLSVYLKWAYYGYETYKNSFFKFTPGVTVIHNFI